MIQIQNLYRNHFNLSRYNQHFKGIVGVRQSTLKIKRMNLTKVSVVRSRLNIRGCWWMVVIKEGFSRRGLPLEETVFA
jgi:hypothetical protein